MARKKSWRDVVEIHPAAQVFPMMSEDALIELAKDIRVNTLRNKVSIWEQLTPSGPKKYLLDGRNRLDAMERAGIPVLNAEGTDLLEHLYQETSSMSSFSAGGVVVALNIRRRHLTKVQISKFAFRALEADRELLASFKKPSSDQLRQDGAVSRNQRGQVTPGSASPNKSDVATVAEITGFSRRTVTRAKAEKDAEDAGKPSVSKPPPAKQKPAPKPPAEPKPSPAEVKAQREAEKTSELITGIAVALQDAAADMKALAKRNLTEEHRAGIAKQAPILRELTLAVGGISRSTTE